MFFLQVERQSKTSRPSFSTK